MEDTKRRIISILWESTRIALLTLITSVLIWYHGYCVEDFPNCPEEECPPISVVGNLNQWRSEERVLMASIQSGILSLGCIAQLYLMPRKIPITLGDLKAAKRFFTDLVHLIWIIVTTRIARVYKKYIEPENNVALDQIEMISFNDPEASSLSEGEEASTWI